jgi:menaquinone-9 beta-reductase
MQKVDVLIVGGGPAGSACAWRLRQNHVDCLVLDGQTFPRFKPCAGWITPEVVRDIGFNPAEYPFSFTTFKSFLVSVYGVKFKLGTHQHAIRRVEFDDWLLRRANVPVITHTVKSIAREDGGYLVDGEFYGKYLVGAGGTNCPVYRGLFKQASPHPKDALIVAQEEEFAYAYTDPRCYLWFFDNHLPGYAWYVPKANGYVNVGVGGSETSLKARGDSLKHHWNLLVEKLNKLGLVCDHEYRPSGHSYYLRQERGDLRRDNAFLTGDAAGLATRDMGEGISPAIHSGLLAADAILTNREYSVKSIPRFSIFSLLRLRS